MINQSTNKVICATNCVECIASRLELIQLRLQMNMKYCLFVTNTELLDVVLVDVDAATVDPVLDNLTPSVCGLAGSSDTRT